MRASTIHSNTSIGCVAAYRWLMRGAGPGLERAASVCEFSVVVERSGAWGSNLLNRGSMCSISPRRRCILKMNVYCCNNTWLVVRAAESARDGSAPSKSSAHTKCPLV